jgi:hypothetical protein
MKLPRSLVLGLVFLAGCASSVHRGVVAMKVADEEAHVGLGSDELAVGDHVELYHNECTSTAAGERGRSAKSCKKVSTGHGVVTEIINKDYSVVKFADGTKFSEGDTVERHIH